MINKLSIHLKIFLLLILSSLIFSCNPRERSCYAADNFGDSFAEISVPAVSPSATSIYGMEMLNSQYWFDSGYQKSSSALKVTVQNKADFTWTNSLGVLNNRGVGLYMLLADPSINPNQALTNPNILLSNAAAPNGAAFKIYYLGCQGDACPSEDRGDPAAGIKIDSAECTGCKIYFKILARNSLNVSGSYMLTLRGVFLGSGEDPINNLIQLVKETTIRALTAVYNGIIGNSLFQTSVKIFLSMYIAYYCLAFVMGIVKMTIGDFVLHMLKIGIVLAIIDPASYQFMQRQLIDFFYGGMFDLVKILKPSVGDAGMIFGGILQKIANNHIWYKIVALFWTSPEGFGMGLLFIIIYAVVLLVMSLAVVYGAFAYIFAMLNISFLLSMAPMIAPFLLFRKTMHGIYEQYLKVLTSSMLQSVILIMFFAFFKDVVMTYFQRSIGYTVCNEVVWRVPLLGDFYNYKTSISDKMAVIDVPSAFTDLSGRDCGAYDCRGCRYVDLPFLIPSFDVMSNNPACASVSSTFNSEQARQNMMLNNYNDDQELINHFLLKKIPSVNDVAMLLAVVVLFYIMLQLVGPIAQQLSLMPFSWGESASSPIASADEAVEGLKNKEWTKDQDGNSVTFVILRDRLGSKAIGGIGSKIGNYGSMPLLMGTKAGIDKAKEGAKAIKEKYQDWKHKDD